MLELLPEGEPLYPDDYLTDQPERVLVAETVREKLLRHTRAELPFSTAVVVDRFEEAGADGLIRAWCSILVDRPSQKAIVIGRGGAQIKRIGSEARADLERFFRGQAAPGPARARARRVARGRADARRDRRGPPASLARGCAPNPRRPFCFLRCNTESHVLEDARISCGTLECSGL